MPSNFQKRMGSIFRVDDAKIKDMNVASAFRDLMEWIRDYTMEFTVVRDDLRTGTASAAGVVAAAAGSLSAPIALNPYSFFPDIESTQLSGTPLHVVADFQVVPAASADAPMFTLENTAGGGIESYSVAWRYIDA